jgi:hypothetical protein
MKKQIIANINNIANELDKVGLYTEANALTNVMKKLAMDEESAAPMNLAPEKEGMVIVQPSADEDNPYQSSWTVYVSIGDETVNTITTYTDENGRTKLLHDREKANEVARSIPGMYEGVKFKVQTSSPRKHNPLIPGDPRDSYNDRRRY